MLRSFPKPESHTLNVAAFCAQTRSHGPGLRAVVWVQGCPFHCQGCIAPEWQEQHTATLMQTDDLAQRILARPGITGLTISGGEPMHQAGALASLVEQLRWQRPNLDVICFTGFKMGQLIWSGDDGIARLLAQVDVLIDGPYIEAKNNGRGLRGSTNQVVHRLTVTGKQMDYDFENAPRQVEIYVGDGQYLLVGVPPAGVLDALENLR